MASRPGRKHVSWQRDEVVRVAKMTAWMVHTVMNRRRVESFAPAYEEWLPLITECVLGRRYSWADLALHVTQTQGREFTANALLQRGDKAARYGEFNESKDAVLRAYFEIRSARDGGGDIAA